ncbi:hypothetical protein ACFSM5_17590 [Lacibacterium aquatile]|uniref:Uncharacterized protein n=1 Tax=Lacibacterium aquatile TaxID=1168082 RepID=A0ABW5DUG7_9PROT
MMNDQKSFRDFQADLSAEFGLEILGVRHELYFTARRQGKWQPKVLQALRALSALALTIFDLMLRPGPRRVDRQYDGFLVASLPGDNGWQSLRPLLHQAQAAQMKVAALWHPRVGRKDPVGQVAVYWLPRPSLGELWSALRSGLPYLRRRHPTVGSVAAAVSVARCQLWRAAWRRLALQNPAALVLHNDFDLMGAAAVASGLPCMVIQHGVPTDEFFPCSAEIQAVWGKTSAAAFKPQLLPSQRLLMDGLGRIERMPPSTSAAAPDEIVLLSQTHTDLYGVDIKRQLFAWASDIQACGLPLSIWLHPAEAPSAGPYLSARAAPHPGLKTVVGAPKLVLALSSTALIEAAFAGHYVVGLAGDLPGSLAAQLVARPPTRVADVDALAKLWSELQASEAARARLAKAGRAWVEEGFAPTGAAQAEWVRMAARCSRC